jgi:hypothetical protein
MFSYSHKIAVSVDVWRSYHCATSYSISVCNSDGEELTCVGGDDDFDAAWEDACEYAAEHRLTARYVSEAGEILREWEEDEDEDEDE